MMRPDPGLIAAIGIGAGLGGAILLLVAGIRGVRVDPTRPPPRWQRALAAARSASGSARIAGAVAVGFGVLLLTRWPVAAVAGFALVLGWPYLFGGARAEQAQIARLDALAVWTESLRDGLSANASLEQAIPTSVTHAPQLLQPALQRLSGQIRVQTPLEAALRDLAVDLDDPGADRIVAALLLSARRRGDQLEQVLSGLAASVREELDLRRRITAGRAELRRGVQIVAAITVIFAGYLCVFGGAFLDPYDSPGGQVALAVVAAIFASGFLWMRRLSAGTDKKPFLARPGQSMSADDLRVVAALTGHSSDVAADRHQPPPPGGPRWR
jgi:tight adherence protein B